MKLTLTPLQELTVEGMDLEMVWEQMEMRGQVVVDLLEEMFGGGDGEEGEAEESGPEVEEEDSEEDEEDSEDGLGYDLEGEDEDEEEDSEEGEYGEVGEESYGVLASGSNSMDVDSEEDEDEQEKEDPSRGLNLDNFDEPTEGSSRPQRR